MARKKCFVLLLNCVLSVGLVWGTARAAPEVEPSQPMVALTFDDGPYSPVTNRILDALEQVGGRATFFVVGNRVAGCAGVERRCVALGCQIGVHTWDHGAMFTQLSRDEVADQLAQCAQAVTQVTGIEPDLVRPVGGAVNEGVCAQVEQPMILWSIDTRDWATMNPEQTCQAVLDQVQDGDVVLMHDLYPTTADAVEQIVPALAQRGFQLVTVEELAGYKGYDLCGHTTYCRFP